MRSFENLISTLGLLSGAESAASKGTAMVTDPYKAYLSLIDDESVGYDTSIAVAGFLDHLKRFKDLTTREETLNHLWRRNKSEKESVIVKWSSMPQNPENMARAADAVLTILERYSFTIHLDSSVIFRKFKRIIEWKWGTVYSILLALKNKR